MFRKYINLIESHIDELLTHTISDCVANGEHEGFKPYWKLLADERVLSDHDAMTHIAGLISDGYRSGAHPHWELKVVEPEESLEAQMEGEIELQEETIDVVHAHMVVPVAETHGEGQGWYEVSDAEATMWVVEDEHGNPIESFDTRAAADAHSVSMNADMAPSDMAAYKPEKELELVEDDESEEMDLTGGPVFDYIITNGSYLQFTAMNDAAKNAIGGKRMVEYDPNEARDIINLEGVTFYHAGDGPIDADELSEWLDEAGEDDGYDWPEEEELEEEDAVVGDEVTDAPTRFEKSENFVVIINAIHERGERQEEALRELTKRGLWLSAEQKVQAGLE